MMKKIGHAVIGAGFGDEGKGLITDYLCREYTTKHSSPINVRCNGGAQAGHTVIDDGKRHVFGHVGAGTFAGASTFLSSKFIVNPFALHREMDIIGKLTGLRPCIEVHPDCEVTTVFDMALNGLRELARGDNRHGSCGVGINETITRAQAGHSFTIKDLDCQVQEKLRKIFKEWWFPQFEELDKQFKTPSLKTDEYDFAKIFDLANYFTGDDTIFNNETNVLATSYNLFYQVTQRPTLNHCATHYVFEGAQGLQLDEFLGQFPHVTRSITGLASSLLAAYELGVTEITPVYVTRCYKTRHGAGLLKHEGRSITDKVLADNTNVTGQWQGEFRYAPLDIDELASFIMADLNRARSLAEILRININPSELAITCLDQMGEMVKIMWGDSSFNLTPDELVKILNSKVLQTIYTSYGPSASDVIELTKNRHAYI
jgi:adenylosuccinate synthase